MNKQRDRLVELLDNATVEKTQCYPNGIPALMYCGKAVNRNTAIQLADKIIADGWMRPPCKVGDVLYVVDYTRLGNMMFECTIEEISHFTYGTYYYLNWGLHIPRFKACQENSFGKTVFLSREEAEQALVTDTNVGGKTKEGVQE